MPSLEAPVVLGRRAVKVIALCLMALTLLFMAGCGEADALPEQNPHSEAFVAMAQASRSEAEAMGASDNQLARLDEAISDGVLSLEVAQSALSAFFGCLEDRGIGYVDGGHATYGEFPRLYYTIQGADPGDECYVSEYFWVDQLYQTQPATLDDIATEVMKRQDGIIACLRDAGIPVDDEPTYDELHEALFYGLFGFNRGDDPASAVDTATVDCYSPVGLDPSDV